MSDFKVGDKVVGIFFDFDGLNSYQIIEGIIMETDGWELLIKREIKASDLLQQSKIRPLLTNALCILPHV